jgi:enoyl-CoA hydratase
MLDSGKIADTHVKIGLAAGDGGALLWPLLIGFNQARKYLLTGAVMSAEEAAGLGLITGHVGSVEALDREVYQLADQLGAGATRAINATKMAINLILRRLLEGVVEAHLGYETYTYLSQDHYEAAKAFRDKRDPVFKGE